MAPALTQEIRSISGKPYRSGRVLPYSNRIGWAVAGDEFQDSEILSVRELLVSYLAEHQTAMGSDLGKLVRDQLPNVDLRETYGGLRSFIETYCQDDIKWIGQNGGNAIFATADYDQKADIGEGAADSGDASAGELWQAFSNPNNTAILAVDIDTGVIQILAGDIGVPENFVEIPSLTSEDYREMCQRFLSQVPEEYRFEFEEALSRENFWPQWTKKLNQYRDDGIFSKWLWFRLREIEGKLIQILEGQGLSREIQEIVARRISRDRKSASVIRARENPSASPSQSSAVSIDLRSLSHRVIDRMSDEELRRQWLPVGVIIDAIRSDRR